MRRLAVLIAALASTPALAESVTLFRQADGGGTAVADAYIWSAFPGNNGGASTSIYTSYPTPAQKQGLFRFDLGAIPDGALVTEAKLQLNAGGTTGEVQHLHRILVPWGERTVSWGSLDGGYDPASEVDFVPVRGTNLVDVTALVGSWVAAGAPNHGVLIEHGLTAETMVFDSSEVSNEALRPRLLVAYVNPDSGEQGGDGGDPGPWSDPMARRVLSVGCAHVPGPGAGALVLGALALLALGWASRATRPS